MQLERIVTMNLRQGMSEIEHRFGDDALIVSHQNIGGKIELIVAIEIEPILDPNEEYALVLGQETRELGLDVSREVTPVRSELPALQQRSESGRRLASVDPRSSSSRAHLKSSSPVGNDAANYHDSEQTDADVRSRPAFEDLLKRVTRLDGCEQALPGQNANRAAERLAVSL